MKLLQLNMWLGRLTPRILDLINTEQPDIITSQEIYRGGDTVLFPDNMTDTYEQIAAMYPYHAFSAAHATMIAHSQVEMGTAVFSKYPIASHDSFFTSGQYIDDLTKESTIAANSRTLQICRIIVDDVEMYVLNHHGYWDRSPLGNHTSVEKMQGIADYITKLDSSLPLIFAGDFNIVPESPAMRPFDGMLEDLVATSGIKTTLSTIRNLPDIPCDHIMTNRHVTVKRLNVVDDLVSDHLGLVLIFSV